MNLKYGTSRRQIFHEYHGFLWTSLNKVLGGASFPRWGPARKRNSWEAVVSPLGLWEEYMDLYVWIRVVTPDWEYTQRVEA